METGIAKYNIENLLEGQQHSITKTISEQAVNDFARLSGDVNPLHMEARFAQSRGFSGRVVHGALLISYVSELIGVHFPGEKCLLQTISFKFLSPAYIDDNLMITAVVYQISIEAGVIILKISIENADTNNILAQGKLQIGFLSESKRQ